jgi:hypothetical protein
LRCAAVLICTPLKVERQKPPPVIDRNCLVPSSAGGPPSFWKSGAQSNDFSRMSASGHSAAAMSV